MKHWILVAAGIAFLFCAAGAAMMSVMFDWLPDSQTITLDPDQEFAAVPIQGRSHGHIGGSFETEDGSTIRFLMLDDEQYEIYLAGGEPVSICLIENDTGDFELDIGGGKYYLVFERLDTSQPTELTIRYVASVTGIIAENLLLSEILAVTGLGLILAGILLWYKDNRKGTVL